MRTDCVYARFLCDDRRKTSNNCVALCCVALMTIRWLRWQHYIALGHHHCNRSTNSFYIYVWFELLEGNNKFRGNRNLTFPGVICTTDVHIYILYVGCMYVRSSPQVADLRQTGRRNMRLLSLVRYMIIL